MTTKTLLIVLPALWNAFVILFMLGAYMHTVRDEPGEADANQTTGKPNNNDQEQQQDQQGR